jgi:hypothetical protein
MSGAPKNQLAREIEWLRGKTPASMLATRPNSHPPDTWTGIAKRVEKVLRESSLAKLLAILEQHNRSQKTPFLLGPHLFQVLWSVEAQRGTRQKMPALDRRPGEIRDHFKSASIKSKELADLLHKGPQPQAVLAQHRERDVFALIMACPILQGPSKSPTIVSLAWLLDSASRELDSMARQIPLAKQHRRIKNKARQNDELRSLASGRLVNAFRERLKRPYYHHVAAIAALLSDLPTNADYVKKIERRMKVPGG